MSEEVEKLNWQRLAITVGIVLVTAAVVGGTVWYLMDQNAKSIADSNTKSITALQKQVDELKVAKISTSTSTVDATMTTTSTTPVPTDNTSSKIYENSDCKFQIANTLGMSWTTSGAQNAWFSKAVFQNAGVTGAEITCSAASIDLVSAKLTDTVGQYTYRVNAEQGDGTSTYYLASSNGRLISIHFVSIQKSDTLTFLQSLTKS